jgi:hypothetical protein
MARMKMYLGEKNYYPQMLSQSFTAQNTTLPVGKTGSVLSLRYSMLERVSGPKRAGGCSSCGK